MRWNSTSFFDMNFVKSLNKDALILIVPVKNCSRELIITDPIIITIAMFLIIPQYDKQTLDDFEPLLILFLLLLRLLLILFFSFWCSHFVSFHYLAAPFFFFLAMFFRHLCIFTNILECFGKGCFINRCYLETIAKACETTESSFLSHA